MGKSAMTLWVIVNSKLFVYQRVNPNKYTVNVITRGWQPSFCCLLLAQFIPVDSREISQKKMVIAPFYNTRGFFISSIHRSSSHFLNHHE